MDEDLQVSANKTAYKNFNVVVVTVTGFLDLITAHKLTHVLEAALQRQFFNIVIDMSNLEYISSSGWAVFLAVLKEIRDNDGDLKLIGMQPEVHDVFHLLEFNFILNAFDTLEEALADFEQNASTSKPRKRRNVFQRAQSNDS